jgi:hypothetical protein
MPEPKVYEFSRHISALCAARGKDVFMLGRKLGVDPLELLRMIKGKVMPTQSVISGLAKELYSEVGWRDQTGLNVSLVPSTCTIWRNMASERFVCLGLHCPQVRATPNVAEMCVLLDHRRSREV